MLWLSKKLLDAFYLFPLSNYYELFEKTLIDQLEVFVLTIYSHLNCVRYYDIILNLIHFGT
jgi:hypothetical protein